MKSPLIVANWKMNLSMEEAIHLTQAVLDHEKLNASPEKSVVLCPSFPYILAVKQMLMGSTVKVGVQDVHEELKGAFTGSVSAPMARDAGASFTLIGHSERRQHHQESSITLKKKMRRAFEVGLHPILCIGESLEDNKSGTGKQTLQTQLEDVLEHDFKNFSIAYEPVWAIGSGKTPTQQDLEAIFGFLRHFLKAYFKGSFSPKLLYGGSVTPDNAKEILNTTEVEGLLVGGASLQAETFCRILDSCNPTTL